MRIRKIRGVSIGLVIALAGFALGLSTTAEGATTESVSLRPGQSVTVTCSGGTLQGTWSTPLIANCAANTTTTTPSTTTTTSTSTTTTTSTSTTTTTSTSTTTTTTPSSSSVAFVQADDTGTINGNTTSIGSGQSNQVLAHDTGIGHSVVLMIQTLTVPRHRDGYRHQRLLRDGHLPLRQLVQRWCRLRDMGLHGHDRRSRHGHGYYADQCLGRPCRGVQHSRHWLRRRWWPGR